MLTPCLVAGDEPWHSLAPVSSTSPTFVMLLRYLWHGTISAICAAIRYVQGAKMYLHHKVYATRPRVKRGCGAIVKVTDLNTGDKYKIKTEHAVLNIPSEVNDSSLIT